ncbi:HJR/Mrr/RecB family endonuclease [Pedobacter cryoconitis]|uniref:restriction endonuclease n=1 Tax=Pedobacter cryoconitis TaxID=188932 RepID=UPI001609367E|nr:restriction endonuclease [Pedobacter cryoconitis]MBB6271903.1 HJR/Mrr/RecB family endonuclease [Pedobacter cryoconitis]
MGTSESFSPTALYFNSENFVGRESELQFLKTRVIDEKKRVGIISGGWGMGKTSLVRCFAERNSAYFNDGIEVLSLPLTLNSYPKLNPTTKLVLIDNFDRTLTPDVTHRVLTFIDNNPDLQYLLIDSAPDALMKRHANFQLTLDVLSEGDSSLMLLKLLETRMPQKEVVNLLSLTQGHPQLIGLISHYLNDPYRNYNLAEIKEIIWQNISFQGIKDINGQILVHDSLAYKQIAADIQIVNGSALNRFKYRPEEIFKLTPREFEEMTAELLEKRGYNVDLTKATRDGGKDLIVAQHSDLGNFVYYVECKQYRSDRPVGVNLVRELAGAVWADRVTAGIVITSSYFSPEAIEFSNQIKHQMNLVDFVKLRDWLNKI